MADMNARSINMRMLNVRKPTMPSNHIRNVARKYSSFLSVLADHAVKRRMQQLAPPTKAARAKVRARVKIRIRIAAPAEVLVRVKVTRERKAVANQTVPPTLLVEGSRKVLVAEKEGVRIPVLLSVAAMLSPVNALMDQPANSNTVLRKSLKMIRNVLLSLKLLIRLLGNTDPTDAETVDFIVLGRGGASVALGAMSNYILLGNVEERYWIVSLSWRGALMTRLR